MKNWDQQEFPKDINVSQSLFVIFIDFFLFMKCQMQATSSALQYY